MLVIVRDAADAKAITEPLTLAVEVLSPSTRRKDQVLKRSKYEEAGVASLWFVDPDGPPVLALDLIQGRYVVAGEGAGADAVPLRLPFPVTVTPSNLVS